MGGRTVAGILAVEEAIVHKKLLILSRPVVQGVKLK